MDILWTHVPDSKCDQTKYIVQCLGYFFQSCLEILVVKNNSTNKKNTVHDKEFYIIGGGIVRSLVSGHELSQKGHVVHVFEKRRKKVLVVCKTEYKDGKVLYETGPWRIHPSHTRLRKLLDKFGLEIKPIHHSIRRSGFGKTDNLDESDVFPFP